MYSNHLQDDKYKSFFLFLHCDGVSQVTVCLQDKIIITNYSIKGDLNHPKNKVHRTVLIQPSFIQEAHHFYLFNCCTTSCIMCILLWVSWILWKWKFVSILYHKLQQISNLNIWSRTKSSCSYYTGHWW